MGSLLGHENTPGLPRIEDYIADYCRRTGRTGIPDLDIYMAYNFFRLAAILQVSWAGCATARRPMPRPPTWRVRCGRSPRPRGALPKGPGMSDIKIGLALGGGSARGLAHIPMLEVFDEMGLKPRHRRLLDGIADCRGLCWRTERQGDS